MECKEQKERMPNGFIASILSFLCLMYTAVASPARAFERGEENPFTCIESVENHPLKYNKHTYVVSGYLVAIQDEWYLFSDEDAAKYEMVWRAMKVLVTEETLIEKRVKLEGGDHRIVLDPQDIHSRWVLVIGRINTNKNGERNLLVGTIENVTRIVMLDAEGGQTATP